MADQPGFDSAVSVELKTKSGKIYDLNNISGKTKKDLIDSGDMTPEKFICPPNMSGPKLKALRAEYLEKLKANGYDVKAIGSTDEPDEVVVKGETVKVPKNKIKSGGNQFVEGDHVVYEKKVTEVLKTDAVRGVCIKVIRGKGKKSEVKKIWVHHSKVKRIDAE